jgi:hypothetical protein
MTQQDAADSYEKGAALETMQCPFHGATPHFQLIRESGGSLQWGLFSGRIVWYDRTGLKHISVLDYFTEFGEWV